MIEELIDEITDRAKYFFIGLSKRGKALRALAPKLGFRYLSRIKYLNLADEIRAMNLFTMAKKDKKITNVLLRQSHREGYKMKIFDFSYQEDFNKRVTTVLVFESALVDIPTFQIQPKSVTDRLGNLFVGNKLDFEGYPVYDKRYKIGGQAAKTMNRLMLRSGLVDDLVDDYIWYIEATGDYIIMYERQKVVNEETMKTFINAGIHQFKTLQKIVLDDFDNEFGIN